MEINTAEALKILNSLKMGIIPNTDLNQFSIGRDAHKAEIKRCIDLIGKGSGLIKFLAGEYGSGKSLMLNLTEQMAKDDRFIVSRIQIDNGFKFTDISVLYYQIMHNLSIKSDKDSGTSFEEIFEIWIDQFKRLKNKDNATREINYVISNLNNYNSSFARAFLVYIRSKVSGDNELANATASWIKGERNVPATLKAKFEVKGGVDKENAMDFFKAFNKLIKLLGYKGIVILVDEIELLMKLRSDLRMNAYENIRYLVDSTSDEGFSGCMFCFAGTINFFENSEAGVRSYPALNQRLGDAIDKKNTSLNDIRQTIMYLNGLNVDELQLLTEEILQIHMKAYKWKPQISSQGIKIWVMLALRNNDLDTSKPNTREFIVKLLEILDIMEQHPSYNIFNKEGNM